MKPPFPYYGGKTRLAADIVRTFPAHGHYVEPFMGSLAVLLAKPPADMETGNGIRGDASKVDGDRVEVLWSNREMAGERQGVLL